jgi:superfamily II DNA or RNA helicase
MNSKVLISTTHSKIVFNENEKEFRSLLKEKFTVRNPALERDPRVLRGYMKAEHCFFDSEYSIIPTGLVPYIRIYSKKAGIPIDFTDYRRFIKHDEAFEAELKTGRAFLGDKELRDYQISALLSVVKYKSGIIDAATGLGKSLIIAGVCKLYPKANILILFDRIELITQTYEKMTKEYGLQDVGMIGGSENFDGKKITLLSVASYQNAFHLFPDTDIIMMDECHSTGRTPTAEKIIYSCQQASQKIGFSATVAPIENEFEKMKLHGNIGPTIYKREYSEARDAETLADISVTMYKIGELGDKEITGSWNDVYDTIKIKSADEIEYYEGQGYEIKKLGQDTVARKFVEYGDESILYTYNVERNNLIAKIAKQSGRTLILFGKLAHGTELKKLISDAILISGENDKKDRNDAKAELSKNNKATVLASSIFDVGIDIPEIETLILAGSSVSNVRTLQKIGRLTRLSEKTGKISGEVIDFYQCDNNLSLKQSKKRKMIYEKIMKIKVTMV